MKKFIQLSKEIKFFEIDNVSILGNPRTGRIIGLNDEGVEFVKQLFDGIEIDENELSDNLKALYNELIRSKYIKSNNNSFPGLDTVYFHVTSRCNLKCDGCYSFEEQRNKRTDFNYNQFKTILQNIHNANTKNLIFSGGEPFLHTDIVEILKYAKKELQIPNVVCISNGTIQIEKYREALPYLDTLAFSLDSYDESYSIIRPKEVFLEVVKKIKLLSNDIRIQIIFTLHKKNMMDYEKIRNYAKELNVNYNFSLLTVSDDNKSPCNNELCFKSIDDFQVLSELINQHNDVNIQDTVSNKELGCRTSCGAGKHILSIGSDGAVYPCHMFYDDKFCLGNALETDLKNICNDNAKNLFCLLSVDDVEVCKDCEYKYLCGAGCRYRSYAFYNDIKRKDTLCCIDLLQKSFNKLCGR